MHMHVLLFLIINLINLIKIMNIIVSKNGELYSHCWSCYLTA